MEKVRATDGEMPMHAQGGPLRIDVRPLKPEPFSLTQAYEQGDLPTHLV